MEYQELLTSKGWVKGRVCGTCGGGVTKIPFSHPQKPNHLIEVMPKSGLWRYKINNIKKYGGSIQNLKHQHFLQ